MNSLNSQPLRILVVDDDAAIRRAYRTIFESAPAPSAQLSALIGASPAPEAAAEPFDLILAEQGEEAARLHRAALASGQPCQVAFIDMRMPPGWDGLQTARALRAQDPSIYLVISTAFADYDVTELQQALGYDVVLLRKPFTREEAYQLARTLGQSWYTRERLERTTAEIERQVFARTTELDKRILQQAALAEIATRCVELDASDNLDDAVHWSLARLGKVTGADHASLIRLDSSGQSYSMSHEWLALGMPSARPRMQSIAINDGRAALTLLRQAGRFGFNTLAELPVEAPVISALALSGIQAITSVAIMSGEQLSAILSIAAAQVGNHWDAHDEALLHTAGHLILRTLEVTEAQQKLARSDASFRALVQNIPGAVYRCELDAHWTVRFLSDHIETLSGYPLADFIDNRVRSYASLIHPDDVALVDREVRQAVDRHAPYALDYRIIHADHRIRWVHERGQASWNRHGEVAWLEGVITDITAAKRFETALRATADFVAEPGSAGFAAELVTHAASTLGLDYIHVAHLLPGGQRVATEAAWLDGQVIANWSYDLSCTPCAEVLFQARRLIPSGVQAKYPKDADLVGVGAEGYVGEPIIDSAGKVLGLIVGISRKAMAYGEMVQANLRILAARTAAEWQQQEALHIIEQERDTIRNLLNTADAIIVALDREARISLINRKGCELLGYSEAELIGQDWFATCLPVGTELEPVRDIFQKALAADLAGSEYYENSVRTRSGESRLIAWHNSSIRDASGAVVGGMSAGMDITERRRAEQRLHASEERFRRLFDESSSLAIQGYLGDGTVVEWNRASERLYGYSAEEAIGASLYDLIIPGEAIEMVRAAVRTMVEGGEPIAPGRLRLKHKTGELIPVYSSHTLVAAPGEATLMFCMDLDMRDLERAEAALNIALTKYKTLFDCFPMGITVTDAAGRIIETNAAATQLLGISAEQHMLRDIDAPEWRIVRPDGSPMPAEEFAGVRALHSGQRVENVEMGVVKPDGSTTWISVSADQLPLEGYGVVVTYADISARREAEAQIRQMAYRDALTGLPNRRLLMDRLEQALNASQRSGEYGALLMLDLDHFKGLNDSLGHDVGDRLLIEVAQRLEYDVRQTDSVARLGGDEYVVMLEGLGSEPTEAGRQAEAIAEKLRLALAQPYSLVAGQPAYQSSASIGLCLFQGHAETAAALLKFADVALYRAKGEGRNRVAMATPTGPNEAPLKA